MSFAGKLIQIYFNLAYNPVYDLIVARLNRYQELQRRCIGKLELEDKDKILCVGIGTGNEIYHILQANTNVDIIGVDFSRTALRKACKKALRLGKEIEVYVMNTKCLEFTNASFDKVLCLHVMDFVDDTNIATNEIFRVLKDGGQLVITYPSNREGFRLGFNLISDNIRQPTYSRKHRIKVLIESVARMLVGIFYLPLLFRPKRKSYSRDELEAMITGLTKGCFQIEEDLVYQDLIVYGRKITEGE